MRSRQGIFVAKNKKKKKDKKGGKSAAAGAVKVTKRLRDLTQNPLVADLVAATLVAAASALKDTKKAHQLAASAEKDLEELGRKGARRGNALWQLALDVGQKSLDALGEAGAKPAKPSPRKAAARPARAKPAASRSAAAKPAKPRKKSTARPKK